MYSILFMIIIFKNRKLSFTNTSLKKSLDLLQMNKEKTTLNYINLILY